MDLPIKAEIKATIPEDVVRDQSKNLSNLISPFVEGMGWVGDAIRLGRMDTFEKTLQKASQICKEHGIPIDGLPMKFMIPFAEKCSYEDVESEMVNRWASLLASSVEDQEVHPAFIDILSQISTKEAMLLRDIWKKRPPSEVNQLELFLRQNPDLSRIDYGSITDPLTRGPKYGFFIHGSTFQDGKYPNEPGPRQDNIKSLQILERQNLVKSETFSEVDVNGRRVVEIYAVLTPLGYAFTEACEKYNT